MRPLISADGVTTIAFLYNNILLLPDHSIIGVKLGYCIFGVDGILKAKFFRGTLFSLNGDTFGIEAVNQLPPDEHHKQLIDKAWQIISSIKSHTCPTIEPTGKWSSLPLVDLFSPSMALSN